VTGTPVRKLSGLSRQSFRPDLEAAAVGAFGTLVEERTGVGPVADGEHLEEPEGGDD
jgi:hypothetical protein